MQSGEIIGIVTSPSRSIQAIVRETHPDGTVTAEAIGRDGKTYHAKPHPNGIKSASTRRVLWVPVGGAK